MSHMGGCVYLDIVVNLVILNVTRRETALKTDAVVPFRGLFELMPVLKTPSFVLMAGVSFQL